MSKKAVLALEDGTIFEGTSFGSEGETFGEAVFNTSMTGYQEILTDPSYIRQIVTITYPMVGNYGILPDEAESDGIKVAGFVVRELCKNFSSSSPDAISLDQYLKENNVIGIEGIDTRKLTRHLRDNGAMRAAISTKTLDSKELIKKIAASPKMAGLNLTEEASCQEAYDFGNKETAKYIIAALDYGIKSNILRNLAAKDCYIKVFPQSSSAEDILSMNPDGIFISNGPGDPAAALDAVDCLKKLIGKKPIFGICFGHQLLCQALGCKTYKLKFGHRGGNHPVKNLKTGSIEISAQNHGFCVDKESLPDDLEITHMNLNDDTIEGIKHKTLPVISVQYHPEDAPGPHDSRYIFDDFISLIEESKKA